MLVVCLADDTVPRLEVLLHQLGQQVYASSHPDEDKKAGLTGLRGEPSPVVSEVCREWSSDTDGERVFQWRRESDQGVGVCPSRAHDDGAQLCGPFGGVVQRMF